MGRPPLPLGTSGNISVREVGDSWRARCRVRDYDGRVRYLVRHGATKTAATDAVKIALRDRDDQGGDLLTRDTKAHNLIVAWLEDVERGDLAVTTKRRYKDIVEQYVDPGLGQLRIRELTVPALDRFLVALVDKHGTATAKGCRSVVSGVVNLAMRYGLLTSNPVRDTKPIREPRRKPRALTVAETKTLLDKLRVDDEAKRLDLVDLVEFMLGTGCRIGEAAAIVADDVDLDAGLVSISRSAYRGQLQDRTKTDSSRRTIAVPAHIVALVKRRLEDDQVNTSTVIFASMYGKVRDTSNTTGDLRRVLDDLGFDWVTSHTFRKTVATRLDDAGLSARQIADHLGHAQPSMTQDVYMGRGVAAPDAAKILDISGH